MYYPEVDAVEHSAVPVEQRRLELARGGVGNGVDGAKHGETFDLVVAKVQFEVTNAVHVTEDGGSWERADLCSAHRESDSVAAQSFERFRGDLNERNAKWDRIESTLPFFVCHFP